MSEENASFDDSPIITYSNRIQKHMFILTEELAMIDVIRKAQKVRLRLIIANLPPQAKKDLASIYEACESEVPVENSSVFHRMYGEVSDWIYKNILQDAFKARPKYSGPGRL